MRATLSLLLCLAGSGCLRVDTKYRDPWHETVAAAGIVEKTFERGDVKLTYAEGPANGPPLVLLHAQHLDWFSYSRVLPELSKTFRVFAVSYHGHGASRSPAERLDAAHIGEDLAAFIETVIGEPVFVTGNSSGGLLATWLAANRPQWVRAVLLEDPPLFSAEFPRVKQTIAFRSFTTCHSFLEDGASTDFLLFWLEANRNFVIKRAGEEGLEALRAGIADYRAANPGARLELNVLPDITRMLMRGLDVYDPRFGDRFFDGTWNAGFDHADALSRIEAPTLLLHAHFATLEDGTLDGAMDQADADRVRSLLKKGTYEKLDAQHTVHLDKPADFIRLTRTFFEGK